MNLAAKYGVNAIFKIQIRISGTITRFEFTGKDSGYALNEYNQARSSGCDWVYIIKFCDESPKISRGGFKWQNNQVGLQQFRIC